MGSISHLKAEKSINAIITAAIEIQIKIFSMVS